MRAGCIAKFPEGRRADVIDALARAVSEGAPGATLLHRACLPDRNRSVLTIVGPPEPVAEAAFRCVAEAVKRIDLRGHGSLGVAEIAFVPSKAGMRLASVTAARIESELGVPTRLFDAACPKGTTLAELMAEAPQGHPKAGIVCVGARESMVALEVDIEGGDAQRIADGIGKLPGVRARALEGRVEVEILDWRETSPLRALAEISKHATVRRTEVLEVPRDAVDAGFAEALRSAPPAVLDLPPPSFLERLAAPIASPGGGSAAAFVGAMAAALVEMCTGLSEIEEARARAEELRRDLEALVEEDAAAFSEYLKTKSDDALKRATLVPLLIAEKSAEVLLLAQGAAPKVAKAAIPDLKGAMRFAGAASEHAAATARYNLQELQDKDFVQEVRLRLLRIP